MFSRKAILSIKSALSLFSEISLPLAIVYLFRGQKYAHSAGWGCFTQSYNSTEIQNHILFPFCFLVILDIQVTFIVVLLSIEHICLIYLWFSNVGRFFFLLGAVKVENCGETVLQSELGIRHKGRTGSEIGNYSWKKVNT